LESTFKAEGAEKKLAKLAVPECSIAYVRQEEMKGTGHAMLAAAPFLGDSPFVMAFPDDIFLGEPPLAKQLVDVHNQTGCSVLGLFEEEGDVSRYGVAEVHQEDDVLRVTNLIEKPAPGTEPSKLVSYGRFLITPDIFPHLREAFRKHENGEFYHTEGILGLIREKKVVGHIYKNQRLDTGEPYGYLESMIEYALTRPEYRDKLMSYMKGKVAESR
jgi:UTP--glucose-1-phosphate uridylyltransferase